MEDITERKLRVAPRAARVVHSTIELPTHEEAEDARLQAAVEAAYNNAYLIIWGEGASFTSAESHLMWLQLIELMLGSYTVEFTHELVQERNRIVHQIRDE